MYSNEGGGRVWVRWNCIIVATPRKPAPLGVMCIYVGIMWMEITPIFGHNAMGVSLTDTHRHTNRDILCKLFVETFDILITR